jgi:hypothetical protein
MRTPTETIGKRPLEPLLNASRIRFVPFRWAAVQSAGWAGAAGKQRERA